LRALELLGKSQGDFVDKQDVRSDVMIYRLTWDEGRQASTRRKSSSDSREGCEPS
jgi:hypothetical protein